MEKYSWKQQQWKLVLGHRQGSADLLAKHIIHYICENKPYVIFIVQNVRPSDRGALGLWLLLLPLSPAMVAGILMNFSIKLYV